MKRISVILAFVFVQNTVFAQGNFTADPEKYLDQVKNYLGQYDKREAKDFVDAFKPIWLGIPGNIQSQVYATSNALADKGMKPVPEFIGYLTAIKYLAEHNMLNSVYPSWQEVLNATFEAKDRKQLPEFLKFCYEFFTDGTIYKTASSQWQISGNDYKFEYDKFPKVIINKTDVTCIAKKDTLTIYETSGILQPLKDRFDGKGGVVTWSRADLPRSETRAELNKYDISLKSIGFDADSVTFYTPYFSQPLKGRLNERITSSVRGGKATYPQFQSYSKRLFIKNIFPNIDYDGGFMLQGSNLQGFGTIDDLAQLIFYRKGKVFMRSSSTLFTIRPESIDAERAEAVIYVDKDSISHPGLRFSYLKNDSKVLLSRDKNGLSRSPFFNTYHNLEMYFEALHWRMEDPVIEMGPITNKSQEKKGRFESNNFFSTAYYNELRGMDATHPMVPIEQLSIRKDTVVLNIDDIASFMGRPTDQIMPVIGALNNGGFISYDPDSRLVTVKKKLYNYLKSAAKKIDYDPIEIESDIADGMNATFNLQNYDLLIRGVMKVTLSDSQFVRIYPDKKEITVLKNRNIRFGGLINAGNTEYFGPEFFFDYEHYKLDLLKCDSMRLRITQRTKEGLRPVRIKSVIRGVEGTITIDGSENKSGLKKGFGNFPILKSNKPTYVYYSSKDIHRGVYDSTKFFFKVDPFTMDSLDNFNPVTQNFSGEFTSAGILPVMKEKLSIQNDLSLGFVRKLPAEGIKIYGDKAVFNNEVRLSNEGLQADGKISFLTSTADSKAFTLFPDSLSGLAQTYVNVEKVNPKPEVPAVSGKNVIVRYHPKLKVMYAQSTDSLLNMFGDQCKMRGFTALRPEGMTGRGRIKFGNAEISSRHFKFKAKVIDSDTASFKLLNYDVKNELAFKTDNVNAHIDFTERFGEFKSNGAETFIEFPENQYICYMDKFKWFMDNENIELEAAKKGQQSVNIETDVDLAGANFYSTHPEQDSLRFMAPKAMFDLRKKIITCNKVEYLNIGDARIYPDSQRVVIRKKAEMETLKNAKIVANYITMYHSIYNATVDIKARKKYQAEGDYSYMDENKMEQKLHFANISLDTSLQTYAKGEIKEEEKFMLSPHFEYKGGVELKANDKGLNFNGATRLVHNCEAIPRNWLYFKGVVDPLDIKIPVGESMVNIDGGFLGAGLSVNSDSICLYPNFLSIKSNKDHPNIIESRGFLKFDKRLQEYQIASEDKLKEEMLPGNFVGFAKEKCEIRGDGELNFGTLLGQVQVRPFGSVNYNLVSGKAIMKATIVIDFPFNENAMEKMAEKITNYPDIVTFDYTKSNYEKAVRQLLGIEKADKVIADLSLHGEIKRLPDELNKALVLADVQLKWDAESNSWISEGQIGISNIYKKQIFKYVSGRVIITKGRKYDIITILIKLDDQNWYYFTYEGLKETMEVVASDNNFNTIVQETKDDKRKFKGEKGQRDYEFRYNATKRSKAVQIVDDIK